MDFQDWPEQRQFIIEQLIAAGFGAAEQFTDAHIEQWVDDNVTAGAAELGIDHAETQAWVDFTAANGPTQQQPFTPPTGPSSSTGRPAGGGGGGGGGAGANPNVSNAPGSGNIGGTIASDDVPVPVEWEQYLAKQGWYTPADHRGGRDAQGLPVWTAAVLDPETQDRIVAAAKAWDASPENRGVKAEDKLIPTTDYDHDSADPNVTNWATLVDNIDAMGRSPKEYLFEETFETEMRSYVAVMTTDGHPILVYDKAFESIGTYAEGMNLSQIKRAVIAGYDAEVPWELVLFAQGILSGPQAGAAGGQAVPAEGQRPDPPTKTMADIAALISEGMGKYGDDATFALIHAVNPVLAANIRRRPFNLTSEQVMAKDLIVKDMFDYTNSQHGVSLAHNRDVLTEVMNLSSEIPDEPIFDRQAPGDLEEAYRTMYRTWFQADPTEEQLAAFVEHFNREFDVYEQEVRAGIFQTSWQRGSGGGGGLVYDQSGRATWANDGGSADAPRQPTAPSAHHEILSTLRADDLYAGRYSKKPAGMEEEAYANVFQQQATDLLGPEAALRPGLAQAGMATGDPGTVGIQAGLSGAGYGSSRFMERLHRGANVIKQWT